MNLKRVRYKQRDFSLDDIDELKQINWNLEKYGCGPTSIANVLVNLGFKINPIDTAKKILYDRNGNLHQTNNIKPVPPFSLRNNIWKYSVGFNDKTGHPAVFPEKLANDHILSWSNEGDIVLDPFMGSGTTAKAAILNKRNYIGFEISKEYCDIANERIRSIKS